MAKDDELSLRALEYENERKEDVVWITHKEVKKQCGRYTTPAHEKSQVGMLSHPA